MNDFIILIICAFLIFIAPQIVVQYHRDQAEYRGCVASAHQATKNITQTSLEENLQICEEL